MQNGPDGPIYPGTCRRQAEPTVARPADSHLRLDMTAVANTMADVVFREIGAGPEGQRGKVETTSRQLTAEIGDVVLARRDFGTSYHLSVVVDDAFQGITHVTRGNDLFSATPIHVVLQRLLELPTPTYCHHKLITDKSGKRLAKRDDARAIRTYRQGGASPTDIRQMVGLA